MIQKTDLSRYNNTAFDTGKPFWYRTCWYFLSALLVQCAWNPSSALRVFLLRLFGARMGAGVVVKPSVHIKYPWRLTVGDHCWIGEKVWIDNLAPVTLGQHVCLSQEAYLLTGNHNYKSPAFDLITLPIVLEDGVWIGARAVVCPGVTVRSHAVLSVGSVAAKELEAYTIYSGNPAEPLRKRDINAC
ncbi:MAG TPA: putative colanic acid biosynthesis acetyltransferase [Lacibacter sp.]|nr:putative colanic acid biosynthesis acetyltransferase [Lacibacter sp.]HMO88675.1 putative colanic acid biosynthesis acetyltransferase [Lacibacter sp.]